jgi:flagellar biosynthesis/type III secretory pathway protein FliH
MSSFRPGPVPLGIAVTAPVWPALTLHPREQAAAPTREEPIAENLLNQARLEASEILSRAAGEAEAAVTEARRQGYEAGLRAGTEAAQGENELQRQQAVWELESAKVQADALRRAAESEARAIQAEGQAEAERQVARARAEAAALLGEARLEQQRYLDAAQEAVVELAIAAATRLVQGQLAIQPAAVIAMVRAGLRQVKDADCRVAISPHDLPLLEAQRSTLERELAGKVLTLQADRSLTPGDYMVSSTRGQIDGTVEGQAEHLRSALTAALGRG